MTKSGRSPTKKKPAKKAAKTAVRKKPARAVVVPPAPTPADFFAAAEFNLNEISRYCWSCYGPKASFFDVDIALSLGSAQAVISLTDQQVCEITAVDNREPKRRQAYRWINPRYVHKLHAEACRRNVNELIAWDDVTWCAVPAAVVLKRLKKLLRDTAALRRPKRVKKKPAGARS